MPTLTRNAQVLRYLLQVAPGAGRTKLAKYAYLADLEARKYLGRPISKFRYVRDHHGPFDSRGFFAALDELTRGDFATEKAIECGDYQGYEISPTEKPLKDNFSSVERAVLEYVATTYLSKTARDLCDDVVYKTEPMKDAKPGKPLPMSKVTRKGAKRNAFELERMIAGEESAKEGRVRPLADVLNALRAQVV